MICFSMLIWWNFCGRRRRTPHFVIFVVWSVVVVSGRVVAPWDKNSYLGLAKISSIASLVYFKDGGGVMGSISSANFHDYLSDYWSHVFPLST